MDDAVASIYTEVWNAWRNGMFLPVDTVMNDIKRQVMTCNCTFRNNIIHDDSSH